jgi:hypothetical protein
VKTQEGESAPAKAQENKSAHQKKDKATAKLVPTLSSSEMVLDVERAEHIAPLLLQQFLNRNDIGNEYGAIHTLIIYFASLPSQCAELNRHITAQIHPVLQPQTTQLLYRYLRV